MPPECELTVLERVTDGLWTIGHAYFETASAVYFYVIKDFFNWDSHRCR